METLSDLVETLRTTLCSTDYELVVCSRVQALKQRGDILTYSAEHKALDNQLKDASKMDHIHSFPQGLRSETKQDVIYHCPTTLDEAVRRAL